MSEYNQLLNFFAENLKQIEINTIFLLRDTNGNILSFNSGHNGDAAGFRVRWRGVTTTHFLDELPFKDGVRMAGGIQALKKFACVAMGDSHHGSIEIDIEYVPENVEGQINRIKAFSERLDAQFHHLPKLDVGDAFDIP